MTGSSHPVCRVTESLQDYLRFVGLDFAEEYRRDMSLQLIG